MGFSPRTAKLLIGSKNVMGCKNGTDLLYHHGKYGGDRGSRVGCRRKSVMFFCLFLSRFGMTKFAITETLWCSVIFKTITVSLHRERFVVVHLYSTFSVDPRNFPLGANLYQKLPFSRFLGLWPHFYNGKIQHEGADLRLPPPRQIFLKLLRGYLSKNLGKFIPKNTNFGDSGL